MRVSGSLLYIPFSDATSEFASAGYLIEFLGHFFRCFCIDDHTFKERPKDLVLVLLNCPGNQRQDQLKQPLVQSE